MSVTKMAGICSLNPTTSMTFKTIHGIRCCSGATDNENKSSTRTKTPQILKLAVSGVTELLRVFSFSGKERLEKVNNKDRDEISVSGIDDVIMILKSDYENAYFVTACDVPGINRLLPSQWRESKFFDNIYELVGVPVVTVQLRYNGWVTELQDLEQSRQLRQASGLDNLLYTPDADFSCFADLALTSPEDYYIEGQGSLLQCVLTPGDPYMPLTNDKIIERVSKQVLALFPSSQGLEVTWSSVVKIAQSLYREGPGKDPFRPDQRTPVKNFFLAGSYTKQDYIDSMEGATLSGRQASAYVCGAGEELVALRNTLAAVESQDGTKSQNVIDELSLV